MNLNHIVDNLDHVVIVIDEGWRYRYVNSYAERALRRTSEQLLGTVVWESTPELIGSEFERGCRRAMAEQSTIEMETFGRISPAYYNVQIQPTDDGLSIFATDLTRRLDQENALRESERAARSALDALSAHIAILDETGTVKAVNRAWRSFVENHPASSIVHMVAVGENYLEHCDGIATAEADDARELAEGIRAVISGEQEQFTIEYPVEVSAGHCWFVSRVTRFGDDGPTRVVVAHEEITELRRAQQRLEASQTELRHQLELTNTITCKAAEGMFLMDGEGRVTFLNPAAEKMFGWSRDEMLGKVLHDVLHYKHPDGTPFPMSECPLGAVMSRGNTVHEHEDVFFRKDGVPVHVSCSNAPVTEQGSITGAVLVVRDIGDHKKAADILRHTEERYRMVARATNDVIWDWDLTEDEILWNDGIGTVFGYMLDSPVTEGDWWKERIHPDDRDRVIESIYGIIDGDGHSWNQEYRFRVSNDAYATILDRGYVYRNDHGQAVRMIGSMLDLTERKRGEEALKRAKEEAEAASQAKDQFIAVMSHELRTPLTPALASIQVLEEGELPPELQPFIEIIHRNIELEARLIDDLLDLTRIAQGKVDLQPELVDLHTIIRNVVETCHNDIRQKRILLWQNLAAGRHHVWGDPARLHQVFWNILKNAIKFTPGGGSVTIRSDNNGDDGMVRVELVDTGIGIDPATLPFIFDAFSQGEQRNNRRFGGLGLGLAISRSMVEMHNGRIAASSAGKDRGSTFTMEFPVASTPEGTPSGTTNDTETETAAKQACVLLVDDHPDTLNVMKIILERRGLRVHTAMDLRGALDLAAREQFDLVVSDIGLPDGTGHDLLRQLAVAGPIRAIAMSGFGMDEDVRTSLEAGFDEHLVKPVNIRKLEEAIARLLSYSTHGPAAR